MIVGLTKKQKLVFDFICEYVQANGYSPTQTEIKEHFQFKSLGSVQDYIRYLTNAGYLRNDSNTVRGLDPIDPHKPVEEAVEVPLLGQVAAGSPIEALEGTETVSVPQSMIKRGTYFALQINGSSMIEDGILDGDIVLIKRQKSASIGETVVATINHEATIKRYRPSSSGIELHPANSSMSPILVSPHDEFDIKGILVGLIRQY